MEKSYWFRVVILVVSFAAIVWTMQSVKQKGIGSGVGEMIIGDQHPTNRISFCDTRVKGLKTSNGLELYEKGMSWFKKNADSKSETKLDPVDVEKWFGHNCTVKAEDLRPVASNEIQAASPVLIVDFIQGAPEMIKKTASGAFIWKQISFRSSQLESAMKELSALRLAGPEGRANPSED